MTTTTRFSGPERRLEIAEQKIGELEDALALAKDALDFALQFHRALWHGDTAVNVAPEWPEAVELKMEQALAACIHGRA